METVGNSPGLPRSTSSQRRWTYWAEARHVRGVPQLKPVLLGEDFYGTVKPSPNETLVEVESGC